MNFFLSCFCLFLWHGVVAMPQTADPLMLSLEAKLLRKAAEICEDDSQRLQIESDLASHMKMLDDIRSDYDELKGGIHDPAHLSGLYGLPNVGGVTAGSGIVCEYDAADIIPSSDFLWPVPGAYISAGTWTYPGGGLHLGLDLASDMFSDVVAPASGYVLYQSADEPSDSGFLGNYSGFPAGSGNSILLVCPMEDGVWAISFAHLSDRHFVTAGQSVHQGDVIALSGNAGNSTGPHTHIEVFKLDDDFETIISRFVSHPDFSFGCSWDTPAACSEQGCRVRPETVFKEN